MSNEFSMATRNVRKIVFYLGKPSLKKKDDICHLGGGVKNFKMSAFLKLRLKSICHLRHTYFWVKIWWVVGRVFQCFVAGVSVRDREC